MNSDLGAARHPHPHHKFKEVPGAQASHLSLSRITLPGAKTTKLPPGLVLPSEASQDQRSIW